MGAPDLRLVEASITREDPSLDTILELERLLASARSGETIGIAYAAINKAGGYIYHAVGEAADCPTFTRGMLACLDDYLGTLIRALL